MLTARDRQRLEGVHPDLVRVIARASDMANFIVTEGLRTTARQRQLVNAGASQTMNSRHLTGHAVDLAVVIAGGVRWDWPLYGELAKVVKRAAAEEGAAIVWGGDWPTFRDGPHYELERGKYPA